MITRAVRCAAVAVTVMAWLLLGAMVLIVAAAPHFESVTHALTAPYDFESNGPVDPNTP
jgi:hypothetical protein